MQDIIVALISFAGSVVVGVLTLIGVLAQSRKNNDQMQHKLAVNQAVIDSRLEELTREVREHNHFARRIPVLEEQLKVCSHRIGDLEQDSERRKRYD